MSPTIDLHTTSVPLARPFTIARGSQSTAELVHLAIHHEGHTGWGEACPSPAVTGESLEDVRRSLEGLDPGTIDPDDLAGTVNAAGLSGPAAQSALDLALHDLAGKQAGLPAHRLLGLPDDVVPSAATVTFTEQGQARKEAEAWVQRGYLLLKVKIGDAATALARVSAVSQALPEDIPERFPTPEIWVDANESLTLTEALDLAPQLQAKGVTVLEQPLPRDATEALAELANTTELDLFVDEAIQRPADVRALSEMPSNVGVNIKVQKVGGLLEAKACLDAARAQDRKVLVGCNIESGLGIAAGALFAGAADRIDLDGNLFLEHDPFPLPRPMPGHVGTPESLGLGVYPDPRHAPISPI